MTRTLLTTTAAVLLTALAAGPVQAAPVDPMLVPPVPGTDGPTPARAARLAEAWTATDAAPAGDPLHVAGSVYHGARDGDLIRLVRRDAATGARLPFAAPGLPGPELGGPVTDGRSILTITTADGVVRAHDLGGRTRWTATLAGDRPAAWVLPAGDLVLAASGRDCGRYEGDVCERTVLHAFRAETGARAWTRTLTGGAPVAAAAGGRIAVRTLQDRDELYGDDIIPPGQEPAPVVDDSPALVTQLSLANRRLWQREVRGGGDLAADPHAVLVAGDRLCAHGARDGRRLWCAPATHRYHDLTAAGGRLYAGADDLTVPDDHRIAAFDVRTGRRLWTAPGAYPYGPIVAGNGVVWLQSNPDTPVTHLLALRARDGRELRRLPLAEYSTGPVALGHHHVFLIKGGAAVAAYR
ncbi:outer membrane protein assembly factor BamB family protein [Catenuloplanes atrovinosus]|uniref:Outer membrane protein assembly factor BamB n=1 Tax=Catenuloplanes atrovinosus TaxID=137266 RepID=A0AAE4CCR4_9ACTN|nr:PQQ-binding-like beta-propeller repeat protein [Catenuloplanes atrovinosus]MDR7278279.1 outer membrane protein assembly factor BamB [Catenuloplanes atrovinosus]